MSKAESRPHSASGLNARDRSRHRPGARLGLSVLDLPAAIAGVSAGAVAVALAELLAGLVPGFPSLVVSVGALIIALQPPGAKDFVTTLFGTNDKLALNVTVVIVALAIAAVAGIAARRRFSNGIWVFVAIGAVVAFAALNNPLVSAPLAIANVVIAVAVGLAVLWYLLWLAGFEPSLAEREAGGGSRAAAEAGRAGGEATPVWRAGDALGDSIPRAPGGWTTTPGSSTTAPGRPGTIAQGGLMRTTDSDMGPATTSSASSSLSPMPDWARRRFLIQAGGFMVAAGIAGYVGRSLLSRPTATQKATITSLPPAGQTVPPLTAGQSISAPGISSIVTPDSTFYRIDTELIVPQVSTVGWHLDITGMVEHPLTFSYSDLLKLPLFEQYVTLACVSNPVGGPLIGNALWTGVRLKQLLQMAGVKSGASQIVGRAVDGFTVGFPTSWALDPSREPMVVVGMNRKLLPAKHGYPARLIVPGLYGYVSATKWLTQIELTTMEAFNAYWVKLGWNKLGPMVTESRIDHPQAGAHVKAGTVEVDGVAWAGDRGVKSVQIQVDKEPWQDAELSRAISKATWVQWLVHWDAKPGGHYIQVRAIDETGAVQTARTTQPGPGGATGYDMVDVFVG